MGLLIVFITLFIFVCLIWIVWPSAPIPEKKESHTQETPKEESMDKKIKKILSKEKGAVKETKSLLKMDKKQDKKMAELKKKEKHSKKK